ncbi:hypothetical protein AAHE18_05G060700 [Arachis hypogaea]
MVMNSLKSIKPSPLPSTPFTIFLQALRLQPSPSLFRTCDSSSALIFPSPFKSNTSKAFFISASFMLPSPNISINSFNSMNPSPSLSINSNAFAASPSLIPLSKAFAAALYSWTDIFPSLLLSNFSNTHFISSAFGLKLPLLDVKLFLFGDDSLELDLRKLNLDIFLLGYKIMYIFLLRVMIATTW